MLPSNRAWLMIMRLETTLPRGRAPWSRPGPSLPGTTRPGSPKAPDHLRVLADEIVEEESSKARLIDIARLIFCAVSTAPIRPGSDAGFQTKSDSSPNAA